MPPDIHSRNNRDVCRKESEYLICSDIVSELYLLGKRVGVIVDGSVETAHVLMVKSVGRMIKKKEQNI